MGRFNYINLKNFCKVKKKKNTVKGQIKNEEITCTIQVKNVTPIINYLNINVKEY